VLFATTRIPIENRNAPQTYGGFLKFPNIYAKKNPKAFGGAPDFSNLNQYQFLKPKQIYGIISGIPKIPKKIP
jgi:hypothetical protein